MTQNAAAPALAGGPIIACTTHSFGVLTLEAAFRLIRSLDIEYADLIAATFPKQLDPSALAADPDGEAERIGNLAADCGVKLSGCFVGFRDRLGNPAPETRRRAVEFFGAIGRFARRCGIAHVQSGFGRADDSLPRDEQFGIIVETVGAVHRAVAAEGAEYIVEAQRSAAIQTPEDTWRLLRALPELRINHDPGQFACVGAAQQSYESLYARTPHIHMRQARPGVLQERLEEGTIDFRRVVRGLQQAGFDGVYATEYVHFANVPDCSTVDVVTETVKMCDLIREELAAISTSA
jgi:sugar phosphate isomerase/epimerase